jgi:hypothetical protein
MYRHAGAWVLGKTVCLPGAVVEGYSRGNKMEWFPARCCVFKTGCRQD